MLHFNTRDLARKADRREPLPSSLSQTNRHSVKVNNKGLMITPFILQIILKERFVCKYCDVFGKRPNTSYLHKKVKIGI
jgi:hypothetical protein